MKYEDGGPAFPKQDQLLNNGDVLYGCDGMSTRIWLAGQAIQSKDLVEEGTVGEAEQELGLDHGIYKYKDHFPLLLAKRALACADAVIAQDQADMEKSRKEKEAV